MINREKSLREIDTPFYRYPQALVLSFFSPSLYVDVGKRWKGLGILYLLFLIFLAAIPFAFRLTMDFNHFFNEQIIQPLENLPPMVIQNGKVFLDKPMPYLVKNKSGQVVSIVDTTGTIKSMDNVTYPDLTTLITKDKFMYRVAAPQTFMSKADLKPESQVYVQPISENVNQVFDGKNWIESSGIMKVKYFSLGIIYPIVALLFFTIYCVFFLAFSLMGQFLARLFLSMTLSYQQASRLLMVSATPHVIILLLSLTLGITFFGFGFLLLLVLIGYFLFGAWSLKGESFKLVLR